MKVSSRICSSTTLLFCLFCVTHLQAQETFPTSVVTEASVSDTEEPDVWVSLDVYSEQPFLYRAAGRTIFTHPQMPFGAQIDSIMFDGPEDSREYLKRQIFGYTTYQPTGILSDGVSDIAPAFLPYERVEGVVYWKNGSLDRTFPTRIYYEPLHMAVQSRASDGTVITSSSPLAPDLIQNWTAVSDFLNATYEISLYYYQAGQPTVPVPDTEARVGFFHVNYPSRTLLYATPWVTTDALGRGNSTLGTGEYTIAIAGNVPLDKVTVRIDPATEDGTLVSNAYVEKELVIDNMATFDGNLTVTVTDVDGSPLRAWVQCVGGPIGLGQEAPVGKTDSSGEVTLHIPKYGTGSDARSLQVHLAPRVLVVSDLTQFIDGIADGELHAKAPAYFSPHFQLMDGAYSYKDKAPSDPVVRVYADGTQEAGDYDSQTIKRNDDYTRGERLKGVNRLFHPVTPGDTEVAYTCRVFFEDNDEGAEEDEMQAGDSDYVPRKVSQARTPANDTPLHFQYVGVVGLGTPPPATGSILASNLPASQQAAWNTFLQKFVPHDVVFTNGPDVTPDTWFFEVDGYRIGGVFRELENWRRAQTTHIDVVVGILSPGGASSWLTGGASGLSLPGYEHVVLIDPSGGLSHKEHILLHEFLHTLGLDDELAAPVSANGYDPDTGRVVYNGMGIQSAQAIMFDAATEAWPTREEYATLLDRLTLPLIGMAPARTTTPRAAPARVMQISAMLHRVPFEATPGTYQVQVASRAPAFIDIAEPYAPTQAPPNNGMDGRAYGLTMGDGSSTLLRAYELLPVPTVNDEGEPPLDQALVGFINFAFPWNDAARTIAFGAFDHTGAMTGGIPECEIERSANAPTVAWNSKPGNGATLSGQTTFQWETTDPDYKPTLYAWVKISTDGGSNWRAAGNYFPIEQGISRFTLDCDRYPATNDCRIKILVTDDWYTQALEAGPYVLDGYNPDPIATLAAPSHHVSARAPSVVTFPMVLRNTGNSGLTVELQTATLPAWAALVGAKTTRNIVPGGEGIFFFSCSSTVPQTLSGTISVTTNDPARASLAYPVSINFDSQHHAPETLWVKAWGLAEGQSTASPDSLVLLAQEHAGRSNLDATITIRQRFPFDRPMATNLAMQPGQMPGEYRLDWEPGHLPPGRYGAEVTLVDTTTGMSDDNGSNPAGDDFTFEIKRENRAPLLSNLTPQTDSSSYFSILGGENFTLRFTASDPDGDALSFSLDCAMSAEIDAQSGTISGIADEGEVGRQTVRLVATDPFGAQTTAVWYLDVEPPWVPDLARAVPDTSRGTVVTGDTFRLKASCYNLDPQQGCRIDYRPHSASQWTTISTYAYVNQDYYVQYTNGYNWNVTHLQPGAPCELRYVNINAAGQPDTDPPIVVIRRQLEDAAVTRVSAPAYLWPGQRFTLVVKVRNDSTQTWTTSAGYRLVAQSGSDPLTGHGSIALPSGLSVPPGGEAVYALDATAPLTPGQYTSTWQHSRDDLGAYGTSATTTVNVMAAPIPMPSGTRDWMLYH